MFVCFRDWREISDPVEESNLYASTRFLLAVSFGTIYQWLLDVVWTRKIKSIVDSAIYVQWFSIVFL